MLNESDKAWLASNFEAITRRLDTLESSSEATRSKVADISETLVGLGKDVERLDGDVKKLDTDKIKGLETRVTALETKVEAHSTAKNKWAGGVAVLALAWPLLFEWLKGLLK